MKEEIPTCFRCDKPIKVAKDVFCPRCWKGIKEREAARERWADQKRPKEQERREREHQAWRERTMADVPFKKQVEMARVVHLVCPHTARCVLSGAMGPQRGIR
jgi:hypothetical protein